MWSMNFGWCDLPFMLRSRILISSYSIYSRIWMMSLEQIRTAIRSAHIASINFELNELPDNILIVLMTFSNSMLIDWLTLYMDAHATNPYTHIKRRAIKWSAWSHTHTHMQIVVKKINFISTIAHTDTHWYAWARYRTLHKAYIYIYEINFNILWPSGTYSILLQ